MATAQITETLRERCGPWTVSSPARWVASRALADKHWQTEARSRLEESEKRLIDLLSRHDLKPTGGTALFQLVHTHEVSMLYYSLANQCVLVRIFRDISSLRFGLPGTEDEWTRLEQVLAG